MRLATACALLGLLLCQSAQAQFVWVDANGVKHYSDRPPEPGDSGVRMVRTPGAPAAPATGAATPTQEPPPQPGAAQKNADFNKRRAAQAAAGRKAAEDARRNAELKADCGRLRAYEQALAGGERVTRTDANGEQSYFSDAERMRELDEIRSRLAACKEGK